MNAGCETAALLCAGGLAITAPLRPGSPTFSMKKSLLLTSAGLLGGLSLYYIVRAPEEPGSQPAQQASAQKAADISAPAEPSEAEQAQDFGSEALAEKKAPDFQPLHDFRAWEQRYMAATAEERAGMVAEGAALAKVRRPEMKKLIARNPKLALEIAVRPVVRQDLPAEVVAELEKPVSARGDYKAYFGRPQEGAELPADAELTLRYFETPEGDSYRARVFGEMAEAVSKKNVPLRGVAIDRELAVAENPVRQLETGERIMAGTKIDETCPVSNITTPASTATQIEVEPDMPVVELAGRLIRRRAGRSGEFLRHASRHLVGGDWEFPLPLHPRDVSRSNARA
jgi:hypothetical protein